MMLTVEMPVGPLFWRLPVRLSYWVPLLHSKTQCSLGLEFITVCLFMTPTLEATPQGPSVLVSQGVGIVSHMEFSAHRAKIIRKGRVTTLLYMLLHLSCINQAQGWLISYLLHRLLTVTPLWHLTCVCVCVFTFAPHMCVCVHLCTSYVSVCVFNFAGQAGYNPPHPGTPPSSSYANAYYR